MLGAEWFMLKRLLYSTPYSNDSFLTKRKLFYDHQEAKLLFNAPFHTHYFDQLPPLENILSEKWISNNVKSCDKYVCHYFPRVNIVVQIAEKMEGGVKNSTTMEEHKTSPPWENQTN